ncbi:MAG: hypothetical protein ACERKV_05215 [Clostridiaceae bacterium]
MLKIFKMFKKIYSFQKLLLFNMQAPFGASTMNVKYSSLDKIFGLFMFFSTLLYLILADLGLNPFFIIIITDIIILGGFLSYNNDIINTVPCSKTFIVLNLYFSGLIFLIISYLIIVIISVVFAGFLILFLLLTVGLEGGFTSSINLGFNGSILVFLIPLVFYFIMLTIMFIKNKKIKYGLSVSFTLGYLTLLLYFKRFVYKYTLLKDPPDLYFAFENIKNSSLLLNKFIIAFIIIAILSVSTSLILYRGKRIN